MTMYLDSATYPGIPAPASTRLLAREYRPARRGVFFLVVNELLTAYTESPESVKRNQKLKRGPRFGRVTMYRMTPNVTANAKRPIRAVRPNVAGQLRLSLL